MLVIPILSKVKALIESSNQDYKEVGSFLAADLSNNLNQRATFDMKVSNSYMAQLVTDLRVSKNVFLLIIII